MKTKLILTLFIGSMAFGVNGQVKTAPGNTQEQAQKPKITPEKAAENQANRAAKELGLNADQKTKFQEFSLTRINAIKPIREKMKATTDKEEKKVLQGQARGHLKTFNDSVNTILTDEQKVKWEEHKKKTKEQNKIKKEAKVPFEE